MTDKINVDVKAIAKAVAQELKRNTSLVVSPADVAIMCGYEPDSTAARQILADPTFPPSISFTGGGRRRYRRTDVEAWIERKFDDENAALMQALRRC